MQPDLLIGSVLIAGHLHSVHTQIGFHHTWFECIFGIHLRQSNKGSTIVWPGFDKRQSIDGCATIAHRPSWHSARKCIEARAHGIIKIHGILECAGRIRLESYKGLDSANGFAKYEPGPIHGTKKVGHGREIRSSNQFEKYGRTTGSKYTTMYLRHLKIRVHFLLYAN